MRKKKKEQEKEFVITLSEKAADFIEQEAARKNRSVSKEINSVLNQYCHQVNFENFYLNDIQADRKNCGNCNRFQRYYTRVFPGSVFIPMLMGSCSKNKVSWVSCHNMGCIEWEKRTKEY